MEMKDIFAVIMAGGKGERFWPQSRISRPKQFLRLVGDLTLIEQTVERLKAMVNLENIIIITNRDYVAPMQSLLSELPKNNIIGEPVGKDTAPCIALASALIRSKTDSENVIMLTLPSDHIIRDTDALINVLKDSTEMARKGKIVTIGVNPTFPSMGYGYVQCGNPIQTGLSTRFFESKGFKEKPNYITAQKFLSEGNYKWNSGMFVWSLSTIIHAFRKYAPELAKAAEVLKKAAQKGELEKRLEVEYSKLERISIDYAVMEQAENVIIAECSFDWDDVGSWTALRNQMRPSENNNIITGLHIGLDTTDCIIVGDAKHLISTIDVRDLIIVHTEDATLVCHTKSAQRIKQLVQDMSSKPELSRFL